MPSKQKQKKVLSRSQIRNLICNYHPGNVSTESVDETIDILKLIMKDLASPIPKIAKDWRRKSISHDMFTKCHKLRKNFPVVTVIESTKKKPTKKTSTKKVSKGKKTEAVPIYE